MKCLWAGKKFKECCVEVVAGRSMTESTVLKGRHNIKERVRN
jgi:hypothetical protein